MGRKKHVEVDEEIWQELMMEKIRRKKKSINDLIKDLLEEKGF